MSLLSPTNIIEETISPFNPDNDPTNLVGRALVANGGIGPVPFEDTLRAVEMFPHAFNPHFSNTIDPLTGGSFTGTIDFPALDTSILNRLAPTLAPLASFNPATSPVSFGANVLGLSSGHSFADLDPFANTFHQGIDSVFSGLSLAGITPQTLGF